MAKMNSSDRDSYFRGALQDQRHILTTAIKAMAAGDLTQALPLATCIRVLVHETRDSTPLLKRLRSDYLSLEIYHEDTLTGKTMQNYPFTIQVNTSSAGTQMALGLPKDFDGYKLTSVHRWWTDPCLKLFNASPLSRKEIVLGVANKEGAHVDDDMSDKYRRVFSDTSFRVGDKTTGVTPVNITRFMCGQSGIELQDLLNRMFT